MKTRLNATVRLRRSRLVAAGGHALLVVAGGLIVGVDDGVGGHAVGVVGLGPGVDGVDIVEHGHGEEGEHPAAPRGASGRAQTRPHAPRPHAESSGSAGNPHLPRPSNRRGQPGMLPAARVLSHPLRALKLHA